MDIDFKEIGKDMLAAIKNVVGDDLNDIQDMLDDEL